MKNTPPEPEGSCRTETPDGVQFSDGPKGGFNSLYDTGDRRPPIQSGDFQVYQPPVRARDRKPTV